MKRRALLVAAAVGLSGCVATPNDSDTGATATPNETAASVASDEPEESTAEPPELGVAPEEADCPPTDDRVQRVVCYPETTADDSPLSLAPSTDTATLPTATVEFTLRNETEATFETNFYDWRLWKRVDGAWFGIAPRAWPDPLMTLEPGDSHTWTLAVDNTKLSERSNPYTSTESEISLAGLGGGEYAFETDGWFSGQTYENKTRLAARFELAGDSLELVPTEGVVELARNGETVTVGPEAERGEESYGAVCVVSRLSDENDEEARRVIPEQAFRRSELRNTLPFFEEGVEAVRLTDEVDGERPSFARDEPYAIEYEGERYRINSE